MGFHSRILSILVSFLFLFLCVIRDLLLHWPTDEAGDTPLQGEKEQDTSVFSPSPISLSKNDDSQIWAHVEWSMNNLIYEKQTDVSSKKPGILGTKLNWRSFEWKTWLQKSSLHVYEHKVKIRKIAEKISINVEIKAKKKWRKNELSNEYVFTVYI